MVGPVGLVVAFQAVLAKANMVGSRARGWECLEVEQGPETVERVPMEVVTLLVAVAIAGRQLAGQVDTTAQETQGSEEPRAAAARATAHSSFQPRSASQSRHLPRRACPPLAQARPRAPHTRTAAQGPSAALQTRQQLHGR